MPDEHSPQAEPSVALDRVCVVLAQPRNPLNIGAAARAMSNFGFADLRLVAPYRVAAEEAKSAVGAGDVIRGAREFDSVAEAVADVALVVGTTSVGHREVLQNLRTLAVGADEIRERLLGGGRVAILFGSEKFGLTNEELVHCHFLVRIPSRAEHGSINLGQAVAICLYELVRLGNPVVAGDQREQKPADGRDVERLSVLLWDALRISGYSGKQELAQEQKLWRLVRRLDLREDDARIWLGMIRQILWKLGQPR